MVTISLEYFIFFFPQDLVKLYFFFKISFFSFFLKFNLILFLKKKKEEDCFQVPIRSEIF